MAYIRRIVLLGKSGSGKSSLGNTILGDNHAFSVNHTPNSGTRLIRRRTLTVVDTPGLFDTHAPNSSALSPETMRCVEECAPGPHAFILVLKKENFTRQERDIVNLILQHFSDEALRYTILVFTHGDNLQAGMRIEGWAQQNYDLGNILQKCGNRCHVIDNHYWGNSPGSSHDYRNNQNQIDSLLDTIDHMVIASGGSFFTNDLLQNRSLWRRFRDAPTGVQLAILLGVPLSGISVIHNCPVGSCQSVGGPCCAEWRGLGMAKPTHC